MTIIKAATYTPFLRKMSSRHLIQNLIPKKKINKKNK